jgi:hypothetical protein
MTRKERKEYILNLDKVVRRWRNNSNLFCGGCCFSAGQIATLLEKKGIGYKVICWQCGDPNEKSLKEIIVTNKCCHIAIQVTINNEKFIIGGGYDVMNFYNRRVYNIDSNKLIEYDLAGLYAGGWNRKYNRNLNSRFTKTLTNAVSK